MRSGRVVKEIEMPKREQNRNEYVSVAGILKSDYISVLKKLLLYANHI